MQENLREIGPHVMFSPPRIWEDMVTRVQVRIQDAGWLKRKLLGGLPAGGPAGGRRPLAPTGRCRWRPRAATPLARAPGLQRRSRTTWACPGCSGPTPAARALGPDVFRFYHALGVNLKQIYGQTEIVGIAVAAPGRRHPLPHGGHAAAAASEMAISPRGGDPAPEPGGVPGLLQDARGDARRPWPAAGCTPATPGTSRRSRASWWSSTG